MLLCIAIWFSCGAIVSLFEIGELEFKYWPFVHSELIQEIKPEQVMYKEKDLYEPVGTEYRRYKNNGGSMVFSVTDDLNYIQVDMFISGPSNTVSKVKWFDKNDLLLEEDIKLTSRMNCLTIPDKATEAHIQLCTIDNVEIAIVLRSIKLFDGYPAAKVLTKNTLVMALPLFLLALAAMFFPKIFFNNHYRLEETACSFGFYSNYWYSNIPVSSNDSLL